MAQNQLCLPDQVLRTFLQEHLLTGRNHILRTFQESDAFFPLEVLSVAVPLEDIRYQSRKDVHFYFYGYNFLLKKLKYHLTQLFS